MSISNNPASPQDELPILSTHEGSEGRSEVDDASLLTDDEELDDEDVVLIAIIRPARTIGRTNPEFHFDSWYDLLSCFRLTYKGESTIAETRASTMATDL